MDASSSSPASSGGDPPGSAAERERERERLILSIAGYRVRWKLAPVLAENWEAVLMWSERIGATAETFDKSSPRKGEPLIRGRFTFPMEWANPAPRGEPANVCHACGGTGWREIPQPPGALTAAVEQPWIQRCEICAVDGYAAIRGDE